VVNHYLRSQLESITKTCLLGCGCLLFGSYRQKNRPKSKLTSHSRRGDEVRHIKEVLQRDEFVTVANPRGDYRKREVSPAATYPMFTTLLYSMDVGVFRSMCLKVSVVLKYQNRSDAWTP
jgi:hypothetical protein